VRLTELADGSQQVSFVPDANYHGPASFRYTVQDLAGVSSTATVSLTIAAVNDLPVAKGEAFLPVKEDQTITITAAQLLLNDSDVDGNTNNTTDAGALNVKAVSAAQNGTVELLTLADGSQSVVFKPTADYHGPAQFTYTVQDQAGASADAVATLSFEAVNDAPIAKSDAFATDEDTALTIKAADLLGNDLDADIATDGDILRFSVQRQVRHGNAADRP
jgi:Cadherin-like domain